MRKGGTREETFLISFCNKYIRDKLRTVKNYQLYLPTIKLQKKYTK